MNRKELEYYFREVYSLGERIYMQGDKIRISVSNRFSSQKFYLDELGDNLELTKENYHFRLIFKYNPLMNKDGYKLRVSESRVITIEGESKRALIYGLMTLKSIMLKDDNQISLPIIDIVDYPSFEMRGIIEGFYGEPWNHQDRLDCIKFSKLYKLNTFMYAPKDDQYHRKLWRELYPEDIMAKLLELKSLSDENNIDFYYCISPGNDFNYMNENDMGLLYRKLEQVISKGINKFALLLDDIDYSLNQESRNMFKRPGLAHAYICNKVNEYLGQKLMEYFFIMCPTEYSQNWKTEYRTDLGKHLDKEVRVFWTGYDIVAEVINQEDGAIASESFGHKLILWDNYPVNDFNTARVYMGPLVNRGRRLHQYHEGIAANPMNQWQLSKVALITMAHYMWNSEAYQSELSWELAIKDVGTAEYYDVFKLFCEVNRKSTLEYYSIADLEKWIAEKNQQKVYEYFRNIKQAFDTLRNHPNTDLLKEMLPWLDAFDVQFDLMKEYIDGNTLTEYEEKCASLKYVLGIPTALSILKQWGAAKLDLVEKPREKCWVI